MRGVCDYSTRAVREAICEDYSADSVLQALRTLWASTGLPTHLTFDAAQNLTAAGTIFGGLEETHLLNNQLTGILGHMMDLRRPVPYASHRQGLVERNVSMAKKQLKIMLAPRGGTLTGVQAANLLSTVCSFINKRPLLVMGASDGLGYLTPWYLSGHNMEVDNSQKTDNILLNFHPLTKRAVELQTRLEAFKRNFNIFYSKALKTYGKWRTNSEPPTIGSIVHILDKTTTKVNFLQKLRLGRISKYLSPHTVELDFMNQSKREGTTQGLIKSLRTGEAAKVTLKKCVRYLRDLSVIIDPNKESAWAKGVDVDQLIADQDQERQQVGDQEDQGHAQEDAQEEAHEDIPAPAHIYPHLVETVEFLQH